MTVPHIPARYDHVGSFLRPAYLLEAREQKAKGQITPETDGSCHYFWAFARNYRLSEQAVTHQLREGVTRIFREDEAILEAQQRAIDDHPEQGFHNLNIDAGAVHARRLIEALVAQEPPLSTTIPIRALA